MGQGWGNSQFLNLSSCQPLMYCARFASTKLEFKVPPLFVQTLSVRKTDLWPCEDAKHLSQHMNSVIMFDASRNSDTASMARWLRSRGQRKHRSTAHISVGGTGAGAGARAEAEAEAEADIPEASAAKPTSDVRPNSANTSAKRRHHVAAMDQKRRRDDSGNGLRHEVGYNDLECCLMCGSSLDDKPFHQCLSCLQGQYCMMCSSGALAQHPGHSFTLVMPRQKSRNSRSKPDTDGNPPYNGHRDREGRSDGNEEHSDGNEAHRDPTVPEQSPEPRPAFRIPACQNCRVRLYDLRYECQSCVDTNFCSSCRTSHTHPVKAVTHPIGYETDSEGSNGSDKDAGTVIFDDSSCGEDSDALPIGDDDTVESFHRPSSDQGAARSDHGQRHTGGHGQMIRMRELQRASSRPSQLSQEQLSQIGSEITTAMYKMQSNMQSMIGAVERILRNSNQTASGSDLANLTQALPSASLLSFPIDFETLEDDIEVDINTDVSDGDQPSAQPREGKRKRKRKETARTSRQWTSHDRDKLSRLKARGWTDARIGDALGRSAGAISQQWRKQQ